jgi:hypothetical protein
MIKLIIKDLSGDIQKMLFDYKLINVELAHYNVKIEKFNQLSITDISTFGNDYVTWDIFTSEPISMDPHYHIGPEYRIILDGLVKFYFSINDSIYELDLEAGYGINVPDKQVHWFKSYESFTAIRFFTNPEGHVAYNAPDGFKINK